MDTESAFVEPQFAILKRADDKEKMVKKKSFKKPNINRSRSKKR